MTPLVRLFRNLLERLLGRYYEGPEPPPRLELQVAQFRVRHPNATPQEWSAFAARLAGNAYRDGFTRGIEWNERGWPGPAEDPEVVAERMRHDWTLPEYLQPNVLDKPVVPGSEVTLRRELENRRKLAAVGVRPIAFPRR